jgi:hypothetical protein
MSFFESMCGMTGYKPQTTFWTDFAIAEADAVKGVLETYERIMKEWSDNYIYLTELVMVLNWNIWYWHHGESCYAKDLTEAYNELWEKTSEYALDHLKGKELEYYLRTVN